jgi:hypothetical protein
VLSQGYFGEYCEVKYCLNNCSYPNGVCNYTSGECLCRMMYDPYNNSREYKPWDGEDCSYLFAYAAAPRALRACSLWWAMGAAACVVVLQQFMTEDPNHSSNSHAEEQEEEEEEEALATGSDILVYCS